jgi:ABC-2 type transport system ATP-binding protein
MHAIEATDLRRTFRRSKRLFQRSPEFVAVEGVSLAVEPGTIFGLLGPNGAGKTTTIKMLSTLLIPSSGSARVAGFDVVREEREVRRRLGVVLGGDRGLYGKLSARDNLIYFGNLYGMSRDQIGHRADEMLDLVGLLDRAGDRVEGFSRGMKQRLHLARALLHNPPVVFLDEPTIGLDPASAVKLREIVKSLMPDHTVLLTTHYLQEADELCNRIAIIDRGTILLEDTPAMIKRRVGSGHRYLVKVHGNPNGTTLASLRDLPEVDNVAAGQSDDGFTEFTIAAVEEKAVLDGAVRVLQHHGVRIESIQSVEPTLEDAFLALTAGGVA